MLCSNAATALFDHEGQERRGEEAFLFVVRVKRKSMGWMMLLAVLSEKISSGLGEFAPSRYFRTNLHARARAKFMQVRRRNHTGTEQVPLLCTVYPKIDRQGPACLRCPALLLSPNH